MHAKIFDIDGTLIQSASVDEELYYEAVRSLLGDITIRPSLNDYDFVTDSGILAQLLEENGFPIDEKLTAAIKSTFFRLLRSHIDKHGPFPEVPGAALYLEALSDSPIHKVALATGGWRESAELKLRSAGLLKYGFPLATSDDASERTEIMRIALSSLGTTFDSVSYYGDGPWDRDACDELGWTFVAVGSALGGLTSYGD